MASSPSRPDRHASMPGVGVLPGRQGAARRRDPGLLEVAVTARRVSVPVVAQQHHVKFGKIGAKAGRSVNAASGTVWLLWGVIPTTERRERVRPDGI